MAHLDDTPTHDPPQSADSGVRYRVPIGLPLRDEGRRAGAIVSILIHALLIGLLIIPFMMPGSVIERMQQGAGGAGPAGGGGGGRRGTGGSRETLRYVRVSPEPVATPKTLPPVPPPVVKQAAPPIPKPVPVVTPPAPPPQSALPVAQATVASAVPGTNGGGGND